MENPQVRVPAMTERPPIEVLLATFNGEHFLREQIDSLLSQTYSPVTILARDDGSTDTTPAILDEYAVRFPEQFRFIADRTPTGSAQNNFLALMRSTTAPYIAFSDQDDVWLPFKLSQCMDAMQRLETQYPGRTPLLVFTDLQVVDAELTIQTPSLWRHLGSAPAAIYRLERLLGQSVVTGCTMLINGPLLALARSMPPEATMHDRWIGLLASAMGQATYLPEATVLYRQHQSNVIGATVRDPSISTFAKRVSDNSGRRAERLRSELQAEALLRLHAAELHQTKTALLRAYLESGQSSSRMRRLALTLKHGFFRENPAKTAALLLDLSRRATSDG